MKQYRRKVIQLGSKPVADAADAADAANAAHAAAADAAASAAAADDNIAIVVSAAYANDNVAAVAAANATNYTNTPAIEYTIFLMLITSTPPRSIARRTYLIIVTLTRK